MRSELVRFNQLIFFFRLYADHLEQHVLTHACPTRRSSDLAVRPFLVAAALLSAACVALADRRLTPAEIAALLFAAQPVLHVLLAMSAHGHGEIGRAHV